MTTAQDLNKGDSVTWSYGGGHPKGKVDEVVEGKATAKTNSGNEISINGDESNPAVKIKTQSGNMAVKPASNIDGVSTGKPKSNKKDTEKKDTSNKKNGSSKKEQDDSQQKEDGKEEDREEEEESKDENPKMAGSKRTASEVKKDAEEADADEFVPSKDQAKADDKDEVEAGESEEEVDENDGEGKEAADEDGEGEGEGEADGEVVEPATKKAKTDQPKKKNSKKDPKATRTLPARGAKEEAGALNEDELLKDEELEGDD